MAPGEWLCETEWEGTPLEAQVRKDMTQDNGEPYPHGDRRQELVFIGVDLKHHEIQVRILPLSSIITCASPTSRLLVPFLSGGPRRELINIHHV